MRCSAVEEVSPLVLVCAESNTFKFSLRSNKNKRSRPLDFALQWLSILSAFLAGGVHECFHARLSASDYEYQSVLSRTIISVTGATDGGFERKSGRRGSPVVCAGGHISLSLYISLSL